MEAFQQTSYKDGPQQNTNENKRSHIPHSHYNRHKNNMRHMHISIVSRHLATRGNSKILRTHFHHTLAALKKYFPSSLVAGLLNSGQINQPSSKYTYTKSKSKHIHHHYAPSVTLTHTTHIISSTAPTYAPHCHPGFVDRPHQSECTAGQMDEEAGCWTSSRKISLPPLAMVDITIT